MDRKPLRIAIVGAGGLGGLLACHLLRAGGDVSIVARGEHLAAIRRDGITLATNTGRTSFRPTAATDHAAEIGPMDLVVLATKTDAVAATLQHIAPAVGAHTRFLTVQNGLEAPMMTADVYGAERVLASTVHGGGYTAGPGVVSLVNHPDIYDMGIGEYAPGDGQMLNQVVQTLQQAGVPVRICADVHAELWTKFGTMCACSSVGALTRVPIGEWRILPGTRAIVQHVLEEAHAVALAHRVSLPADFVDRVLHELEGIPPAVTFSMQRDVMQGLPSELDYLLGTLVRFGAKVEVATPVASILYHALLPQERRARGITKLP